MVRRFHLGAGMAIAGKKVIILGAGIAGLAVARALALKGALVQVLEQADAIREVGAGLQVSPNGAAVLQALGLGDALIAAGTQAQAVVLRDGYDDGQVLRMDLTGGKPYRFLHRADLIQLLLDGARTEGAQLHLLQKVETIDLAEARPRVITALGAEFEADLLIGADGLHSKVRTALNGRVAPFFTRQVAWRALIPAEAGAAPLAEVFMGAGRHLVSYPLRGGTIRNIVAVEERSSWVEESWSLRDDPMDMRLAFEDFCPRVQGWLGQIQDVNLWGLFRHPVAQIWSKTLPEGAAVILGDAAHPTLPFLAQGAAMGLEDAYVLADLLSRHPIDAALTAYRAARIDRTSRIVAAASTNARAYHLSGAMRGLGHSALRLSGKIAPNFALSRFDWLYHHDVTKSG